MTQNLPDPEQIRKLLRYEPETGKLYWLPRPREMFATGQACGMWNFRYAEREAFTCVKSHGYRHGTIHRKTYTAHRIAWVLFYGEWPKLHIDHVDGDTGNNRISNLREATRSQNMRNSKSAKGATSSFLGVSFKKDCKKWCAQIQTPAGKKHIGYFSDERAAALAYDAEARKYAGEFARLNFPEVVAETEFMGQAVTIRLDPLAAKRAVA